MLAVLLKILAVIGRILLWILAVILILLLIILLCPFGYRGSVKKDGNEIRAGGSAHWLLHIIHVKGSFARINDSNQLDYEIYLFGIPLMKLLKKRRGRDREGAPADAAAVEGSGGASSGETVSPVVSDEDIFAASDRSEKAPAEPVKERTVRTEAPKKPTVEPGRWKYNPTDETEKKAKEIRIEVVPANRPGPFLQAAARFGAAVGKVRKICIRLDRMYYKLEDWLDYFDTVTFQKAKTCVLKNLFSIIRQILPRKISGKVEFGTGDPSSTGEALAVVGALYAFLPEKLAVIPDFEEARADADVEIKGHFMIGGILLRLIFVILNPNIWTLIRVVRKKDPTIASGKRRKKKKKAAKADTDKQKKAA